MDSDGSCVVSESAARFLERKMGTRPLGSDEGGVGIFLFFAERISASNCQKKPENCGEGSENDDGPFQIVLLVFRRLLVNFLL